MIQTYVNLLNKGSNMWKNIIVVITKISYVDDEHKDIDDWIKEMEDTKKNFRTELKRLYKDADPTILAIS